MGVAREASKVCRRRCVPHGGSEGTRNTPCYKENMATENLGTIPDDDLLARLSKLLKRSRHVEAELVAHIGEVDARRLYAREGSSSMFTYATDVLHLFRAPGLRAHHRGPGVAALPAATRDARGRSFASLGRQQARGAPHRGELRGGPRPGDPQDQEEDRRARGGARAPAGRPARHPQAPCACGGAEPTHACPCQLLPAGVAGAGRSRADAASGRRRAAGTGEIQGSVHGERLTPRQIGAPAGAHRRRPRGSDRGGGDGEARATRGEKVWRDEVPSEDAGRHGHLAQLPGRSRGGAARGARARLAAAAAS